MHSLMRKIPIVRNSRLRIPRAINPAIGMDDAFVNAAIIVTDGYIMQTIAAMLMRKAIELPCMV